MTFVTKWLKTGKAHDFVFLGKEVIGTASGNHVIFYNLTTKEERIEYFNSPLRGEGACCLAGHPIVPVFSTAERCFCPKIFVHTFPEIKTLAVCKLDPGPNSYLSCCFAGTEYLVSLTSYTNFELVIWLWRTGEKVTNLRTAVTDLHQVLQASMYSSQLIYQFSTLSGKLWTYEIHTYSKKVFVIKNFIKIDDKTIASAHWMSSGNLLLNDSLQNVYIVSADGKKSQCILFRDFFTDTMNPFLILPYNNTFFTVDNESHLSCYSKTYSENNISESWNLTWSVQCKSHPLKMVLARHKEVILISCQSGEMLELDLTRDNKLNFENIYNDCQKIKFVCILEPDKENIVAVDYLNYLHVIDVLSGVIIATYEMDRGDQVICLASHPHIPLIAVGTSTGKIVYFIKLETNFLMLVTLHLQREPLEKIRFAISGTSLGVSSPMSKYFYMLKTVVAEEINVFFYTEFSIFIIDFLIFEEEQIIKLLVLAQSNPDICVSNYIEVYTLKKWENIVYSKKIVLMNEMYKNLSYCSQKYGDFIGSPYLSKKISFFQFENNFESINLFKMIDSTHTMRKFHMSTSTEYVLTSGYDGFIILRSYSNLPKINNIFMVHHYQEQGIRLAVVLFHENIIISLGNNGSLICITLGELDELNKPISLAKSTIIKSFIRLHKNVHKFKMKEEVTWLEHEKLKLIQKEINRTLILKTIILKDFDSLKHKIRQLLDLNETKGVECQMPVSAFDLNIEIKKRLVDSGVIVQETENIRMQDVINKKEKVINYLIQQFWDTYKVHSCSLTSFDSEIFIKNFKLRDTNKPEKMEDFFIELFDILLPNISTKFNNKPVEEENNGAFNTIEKMPDKTRRANSILYSECSNDIVLSGSTSFRYINNDPPPNQLANIVFDSINSKSSREYRLKVYFNNKFNEIKCLKNKVLNDTKERLKHLKAYQTELQDIFGITIENPYFDDSKWQVEESLENFVTPILENSLSNNRSISVLNSTDQNTSQDSSNSMNRSTSTLPETEQIFREEKLIEMMDGLLEIRWEDEIKKEIPKPFCLLLKHPSKYNDEEIKAVAVYKLKVERLRIERKKYRTHLESQIQCINDKIKVDVVSFDDIMEEFSLEKIKIQSAILQEFLLRLNKYKQQSSKDYETNRLTFIVNNDLMLLESENRVLINEILKIEPVVVELRNKYDNLNKRDKALETKFRSEFGELKQPLVEHLLRQYKRRPKISQISCTSLTCLVETNKCLVSGKRSIILPREYLDFLKGMDVLDIMPNSLPPQIDSNHWQILCKLRRNKVEMEIKLRIASLELAETEQTYFHLQKLSSLLQSKIYFTKNSIEEETLKQSKSLNDSEIQLLVKVGQIEIDLMGSTKDFDTAVVVSYDQLTQINDDIVKEGQTKITAMQTAMIVRKSIVYRRWKYQCMSTKLKHWKENLIILQNTKIGKDMQNYLVERLEGNIHYKDATSSTKILSSIQKKFQRMLKEEKTILRGITQEIRYWREMNAELTNRIKLFESLKQHQKFELEETYLQKKNRTFHKHYLRAIMERTILVEKVKESRNELLNLQTQLELLKLKTYPTLRFKDVGLHKKK